MFNQSIYKARRIFERAMRAPRSRVHGCEFCSPKTPAAQNERAVTVWPPCQLLTSPFSHECFDLLILPHTYILCMPQGVEICFMLDGGHEEGGR